MFCPVTVVFLQPLRLSGQWLRAIAALMLTAFAATLFLITPAAALAADAPVDLSYDAFQPRIDTDTFPFFPGSCPNNPSVTCR